MEDYNVTLSLSAEKAIRLYLFKLIIPTGTVLIVISFLLGFFIQHGAQNEAAKEAFKTATGEMFQAVQNVATAEQDARHMSDRLKDIEREAERNQ